MVQIPIISTAQVAEVVQAAVEESHDLGEDDCTLQGEYFHLDSLGAAEVAVELERLDRPGHAWVDHSALIGDGTLDELTESLNNHLTIVHGIETCVAHVVNSVLNAGLHPESERPDPEFRISFSIDDEERYLQQCNLQNEISTQLGCVIEMDQLSERRIKWSNFMNCILGKMSDDGLLNFDSSSNSKCSSLDDNDSEVE